MRLAYVFPFQIYANANAFCYNWPAVVSSFSSSRITKSYSYLRSADDIDLPMSLDTLNHSHNDTSITFGTEYLAENKSELTSRVLGFYPFPTSPPRGPLGWILKDTHQAIIVTETIPGAAETTESQKIKSKKISLWMDFMTKNGANHPVWYNEIVKWNVFFGGSIDGEVRVTVLGTKMQRQTTNFANEKLNDAKVFQVDGSVSNTVGVKLERMIAYANDYNCRMNLYSNNCRIFAARMEREVIRLNLEGTDNRNTRRKLVLADILCALRIMWAALLPALYPLGAILLLYEGCFVAY